MFELPEMITLARQINETLSEKTIPAGHLGNKPHKFVWYNHSHADFARLTAGKRIGAAYVKGRWLFTPLEPGYVLVFGECGGRIQVHPAGSKPPGAYHLLIEFDDRSALSAATQMWGAYELYEQGQELERQYIKDMRPTPLEAAFTLEYFSGLIEELVKGEKRSAKSLLTQDQLIPGLGNSCAQDILFLAGLHPRHSLEELSAPQVRALYRAIRQTVDEIIAQGGRSDEHDLFDRPGGYQRLMSKDTAGQPCPNCATPVQKIQYLGGSCYFCPSCQL